MVRRAWLYRSARRIQVPRAIATKAPSTTIATLTVPDRIHERDVADDAVVLHMAAPVEELVVEVDARGRRNEKPAGIGRPQCPEHQGGRCRHADEGGQRIGREEGNAKVAGCVDPR